MDNEKGGTWTNETDGGHSSMSECVGSSAAWGVGGLLLGYLAGSGNGFFNRGYGVPYGYGYGVNGAAVGAATDAAVMESVKADLLQSNLTSAFGLQNAINGVNTQVLDAKYANSLDTLNSSFGTAQRISADSLMTNNNINNVKEQVLATRCENSQNIALATANVLANNNNNFAALNEKLFGMQRAADACCCENRLGQKDIINTVIQEGCVTRNSVRDQGDRVVSAITALAANMAQDEISKLREEVLYLKLSAEHAKQTSTTGTAA